MEIIYQISFDEQNQQNNNKIYCDKCDTLINKNQNYCPNCGRGMC